MKMSQDLKKAIDESSLKFVATASKTGKPRVSAKGSLRVLDDEHLVFVDIHSPLTIANLKENSQVAVLCLNFVNRKGCRIWGQAEVLTSGDLFDQAYKEYALRKIKVNHIVKINVEEAMTFHT